MKKSILFITSLIIGVCLQTGCRSLRTSDYSPSSIKLNCPLLPLESLIDFNSFEKIYQQKSTSGLEILCQPQQDFNHIHINDATTVINEDMKQNFPAEPSEKKGYLVYRLKKIEGKNSDLWGLVGGCILTTPQILGAPFYQYKLEAWIEVDVRNLKNVTIATYSGYGKNTARLGYYYGCKQYPQKANIEAIKQALDEVKLKMSPDCNSLNLALNKSMDEIQQERILSTQQSIIEPTNFLDGNNKYNEKDYTSSVDLYNSVLEKYPYHTFALSNRARANSELGDNVSAIKDFTRIIELDPKNVDAFYSRGFAYGKLLELNTAVYNYNKAIELSPDMVQAYLMRAAAEEDLTQNNNAVKDYQKVLSLNPNLIYAKERLNIVQERISQNIAQQQQQLEQDRINRLNALSASLNILSNTLNTVNNTTKTTSVTTTSTSNTSTQNSGTNAHLQKVTCTYCKGTGVSSYPSSGTCFGIESYHFCKECNKTVPCSHGPHLNCLPCQGKGYTEKYVP